MRRILLGLSLSVCVAVALTACGSGAPPTRPTNPTNGGGGGAGGGNQAPPNTPPVIDGITVQGARAKEPANFADLGEPIQVTAAVHDAETPADQLQYQWSATSGAFSGTGPTVTWTAPADAQTPATVTISLTVVEAYAQGAGLAQNKVEGTASLSLHDSTREVGDMARQFLLDFSDSSIRDVDYVMRNFSRAKCPDPREVDSERDDVTNNRKNFKILNYRIGAAAVTLAFGGRCPFRGKAGDACAVVPSYWDSIDLRDNSRGAVDGNDIVAAVYAPPDARWWLCASDFDGHAAFGAARYGFIR